jgi:hypothetical protein
MGLGFSYNWGFQVCEGSGVIEGWQKLIKHWTEVSLLQEKCRVAEGHHAANANRRIL